MASKTKNTKRCFEWKTLSDDVNRHENWRLFLITSVSCSILAFHERFVRVARIVCSCWSLRYLAFRSTLPWRQNYHFHVRVFDASILLAWIVSDLIVLHVHIWLFIGVDDMFQIIRNGCFQNSFNILSAASQCLFLFWCCVDYRRLCTLRHWSHSVYSIGFWLCYVNEVYSIE